MKGSVERHFTEKSANWVTPMLPYKYDFGMKQWENELRDHHRGSVLDLRDLDLCYIRVHFTKRTRHGCQNSSKMMVCGYFNFTV